ncbi:enoyl-ACP reductase [Buchnera aphidicola]|uniref:enoyl-ACP reductase FabI n=1 Tax=Buchnera aphidicola TaxID=9 RepID=UPI003463C2FE
MELLKGKKILITGITNQRSISYGIAKSFFQQGATLAFTYLSKKNQKYIYNIAKEFNSNIVLKCNFLNDNNIKKLFINLLKYWKTFDGFIHSIAYASKNQFQKDYISSINYQNFNIAHNITSYSLVSMVKESKKYLNNHSSIVTLTYLGSKQAIPYYNVMGLAKASLESNVRYIANVIGRQKLRINAISVGPMKTISTYNIKNFNKILSYSAKYSPIHRLVTLEEVGNTAVFLSSNLSTGITGQVIYVDGGLSISMMNHTL